MKTHIGLKLAREELERQNEILRENVRLREEVEHIGRHDLKNPLMVILNLPGMLMSRSNITPDQKKLLKMIEDAGRKMLEMINRSIDLYKMENGAYALHPSSVDVIAVARQIVLANTQTAVEKKVAIEMSVQGKRAAAGDALVVTAEELLLYSMLANLVKNAVEACPQGGRVSLSFSCDKGCVIAIHNAGAIPEKIPSRFFEKFATAEKTGGAGLGAYSAKLIAGTLGAQSISRPRRIPAQRSPWRCHWLECLRFLSQHGSVNNRKTRTMKAQRISPRCGKAQRGGGHVSICSD